MNFQSLVVTLLGRTEPFDLALARTALLGLVAKRMLLPFVSCQDWHGWLSAHYLFFNKVSLNTLDIFFCWILIQVRSGKSLEGSAPTLRFIFSFDVSDVFVGGSEVVREFSPSLPHELASLSHPTYSGLSALATGSDIYLLIRRRSLWTLGRPKVLPDSQGFPKFPEGLLHDCYRRPRKFGSCLLFFSS